MTIYINCVCARVHSENCLLYSRANWLLQNYSTYRDSELETSRILPLSVDNLLDNMHTKSFLFVRHG